MKKLTAILTIIFAVSLINAQETMRSGFVDGFDESKYKEITVSEEEKLESLKGLWLKSKCHIVLNSYDEDDPDLQTRNLRFFGDGKTFFGFWGADGNTFPNEIPLFTSLIVYYHFEETSFRNETVFFCIIDGWRIVDDVRFVGQKYIATDSLKIRSEPNLAAEKIGLLKKGEKVTIQEAGEKVTIDGIESAWVKVRTQEGKEGWCFAGYLTDGTEYKTKPWTSKTE